MQALTSMRGRAARIATILAVAMTVLVVGSLAASAQTATTYPPPTSPPVAVAPAEVSPAVVGAGGGGQPAAPEAELAFTGAELTVLLIVLGGLVLGGAALYVAGRRRARGSEA